MITEPEIPDCQFLKDRLGFQPDVMIHVVGTSFEGRQKLLELVERGCSVQNTPPCKLVREPGNKYDPHAVGVYVTINDGYEIQTLHVGYLPKEYEIPCRATNGRFVIEKGSTVKRPVWKILDNKYGSVLCGIEGVRKKNNTRGLVLGLSHVI